MNTVTESYQPKMRADSFFIPGPDGTYFHNARGWYKLTSKIPYGLVERVVPFLDGTRSVDAITQTLSEAQRKAVNYVLQELSDHGFVRDALGDARVLEDSVLKQYEPEIAFLETMIERPRERFAHFREARILIDAPTLFETTLPALWSLGLRVGAVVGVDSAAVGRLVQTRQRVDATQQAEVVASLETVSLGGFDLVLQIAADLHRAKRLAEYCAAADVPLVQVILFEDFAWVQLPGLEERLPLSFWARSGLEAIRVGADGLAWQGSRGAIVSNLAAQHAFRYLSQTASQKPVAFYFERFSLESTKHRFALHMSERVVGPRSLEEAALEFAALRVLPPVIETDFSKRAAALIDPRLGVLLELDEHDFAQIPLNVAEAKARDARHDVALELRAHGVGTDFTTPRLQATQRAFELYAATAFDVRRFSKRGARLELWALDLITDQPRLIPAELAFATLQGATPQRDMPGLASGFDWNEAVLTALTRLLLQQTKTRALTESLEFAPLELKTILSDPQALRYQRMFEELGLEVRVGLLRSDSPITQVLVAVSGQPIALAAHADPQLAIRDALELTLQHQQSVMHQQSAYDIAKLEGWVSPTWLEFRQALPTIISDPIRAITDFFVHQNISPQIVVLDHDPAVRGTGLIIVNAVLLEGAL
jgi:hypothetical protein